MMSAVGDAVQVLPVLTALKRAFPQTRISWLIQPGPHSLVQGHPAVDEFLLFPRGLRGRTPRALASGSQALRNTARALQELGQRQPGGRFDLLLNLQVYFKAGVLTGLTPAHLKLGFDWRRSRDLNWLFTTHRIPQNPERYSHTQDQYLEFLSYLGVDPEPVTYGLSLSGSERDAQQDFFRKAGRPSCALVVASSNPKKDWTAEGYARVAEGLHFDFDLQPRLVGGNSPNEVEMARRITALSRAPIQNSLGDGLRRLLWLLSGSRLVISPDTGPLHMARAMELPVVGLYGYTNPKRSGPYKMFEDLIVDGYARSPNEDYAISPKRRAGGMGRITPMRVLEKVELALKRYVGKGGDRPDPEKEDPSSF
jgi:heptosyltransferase I